MQSKLGSLVETSVDMITGFIVSAVLTQILMEILGFEAQWHQSFMMTGIITVTSFIRRYFVRRLFNFFSVRRIHVAKS